MKLFNHIANLIHFRKWRAKSLKCKRNALYALPLSILSAATLLSCNMVYEDMDPCATYPNTITKVDFVYDYNMLREDLFDEHAGTAHLYVFNSDSIFLFDRSVSKNDMIGPTVDFSMCFDTTEMKIGHRYLLVAMAQGNHSGYEWSTVVTPGFQIPIDREMIPGVSKISDYRIMLDRDSDSYADIGIVNYKDAYGNNKDMMDTLWSTKPGQIQTVDIPYIEYYPRVEEWPVDTVRVKMPMMRITNAITVNLVHDSYDQNTDVNKYNLLINFPKGNGTIGFTGRTYPNRELVYRSLRKEMAVYKQKNQNAQYEDPGIQTKAAEDGNTYAIQATFGVSRLQTTDDSSLQIRDGQTGDLLLQIGGEGDQSFSQWLADYFNYTYGDQEFLDREYNFGIDIKMSDDNAWEWYQIGCSILGWGKRVYNYTLH